MHYPCEELWYRLTSAKSQVASMSEGEAVDVELDLVVWLLVSIADLVRRRDPNYVFLCVGCR